MKKTLKKKMKSKAGFTLLELLVVVAILAALAGTASVALKDTDARAAAAAHVAMMDQLNEGIHTYRVLQKNTLPTRFDSLLNTSMEDPGCLGFVISESAVAIATLSTDVQQVMLDGGFDSMMYIDDSWTDADSGFSADSTNVQSIISSRKNAIVANNIFMSTDSGSGVGTNLVFDIDDDGNADATLSGVFWATDSERLTGQPDSDAYNANGQEAYLLTGIGPSSSLFDTRNLGGMTSVPVYRHVDADEYGRFIAVWHVGTWDSSEASGIAAVDQLDLITIVDGALDTKEEELGEWDGTRNTI